MALEVYLVTLCLISSTTAGTHGYHDISKLIPSDLHEGIGVQDFEDSSHYEHEHELNVHSDVNEHSFPEELIPSHLEHPHNEEDFHGDSFGEKPSSFVTIKGLGDEKLVYFVDHSGYVGPKKVEVSTHDDGLNSYAEESHGDSFANDKQHPVDSESYNIHSFGGSEAASKHNMYDNVDTYAEGYNHEAVSSSSYKDLAKGTGYSVQQTHGHKGAATVTSKHGEHPTDEHSEDIHTFDSY